MSLIRDGILALLTQGPAYGLQLRNELDARIKRSSRTNVGQVYGTLDRLATSALVVQASRTADGLPLYELTEDGRAQTQQWTQRASIDPQSRWDSMVGQVLLVRSLIDVDSAPLLESMRQYWEHELHRAQDAYAPDVASDLRSSADEALALAALAWLDRVSETDDTGMPISQVRPARGRPTTPKPAV